MTTFAQTGWTGEYYFGEEGGETVGGTKIYIAHTIKITENAGKLGAHLYSQGFQTSRDVYADVKITENKIELYFRKKGEDQYTSDYKKGDLLLTLEKKDINGKTTILTNWGVFQPVIDKNNKSGEVYFKVSTLAKEIKDFASRSESKLQFVSPPAKRGGNLHYLHKTQIFRGQC
jgi:hypothetical protein